MLGSGAARRAQRQWTECVCSSPARHDVRVCHTHSLQTAPYCCPAPVQPAMTQLAAAAARLRRVKALRTRLAAYLLR